MTDKPLLFISYRHADEAMATDLRGWLNQWSLNSIDIFQSTAASGLIGGNLDEELADRLHKAQAVALLYTTIDLDWQYCMWECGVAVDPSKEDTRMVIFQCSEDVPPPFHGKARVDVRSKDSVMTFVRGFLTSPDFFPRFGQSVAPNLDAESSHVTKAGEELYEIFQKYLPDREENREEAWPSLPHVQVSIPSDLAEEIKAARSDSPDEARSLVMDGARIEACDRVASQLFGVPGFSDRAPLDDLVAAWREGGNGNDRWVENMLEQLSAAASWRFPRIEWTLFRCLDGKWYSPVVNWVRREPRRRMIVIDLHFVPFTITDEMDSFCIPVER